MERKDKLDILAEKIKGMNESEVDELILLALKLLDEKGVNTWIEKQKN